MTNNEKQEVVFKFLVNKMLKPHNVDYDYVTANPEIEGEPWYCHYQWTTKEQDVFQQEAVDYIKKTLRVPKDRAGKVAAWFILGYGLKCSDHNNVELKPNNQL
jgi:hypothetical protein